jgi:hypothetical protein
MLSGYASRACGLVLIALGVLGAPARAFGQSDAWQVDIAPLYFWAATTSGNIAINGTRDVPVYMDFADAKSKLGGAFSIHGEAHRGRWGAIGDVNFIRLSTDTSYTTPILNAPIDGSLELDQLIVNGKGTFEVKRGSAFHVAGGIRTFSMSPNVHFTGPAGSQLADIDVSTTSVAGVGGFMYRPRLRDKVVLFTQADIGGGSAFTWSAGAGIELLIKRWVGVAAGYTALHIDTGNVPRSGSGPVHDVQYVITQYGPAFSLTFHLNKQ